MEPRLGLFVREMRASRGLSQAGAARAAGIGRATLARWEAGTHQPRLPEMESLLRVLGVTPEQRREALGLLDTASSRARAREDARRIEVQAGIGPAPHGGALLRALRYRRGVSQEEAAAHIGVTVRTLRRWENSEVWPAPAQLHALCQALGARTAEVAALTTGRLSPANAAQIASTTSPDELRTRAHNLFYFGSEAEPSGALNELDFLILEARAWPLAARSEAGRHVLSYILGLRARHLDFHGRFGESGALANRSLDLRPAGARPEHHHMVSGIMAARSAVQRAARPARGLELLRPWLEATHWLSSKAWLLSDMAGYMAQAGDIQSALKVARQASAMAEHDENIYELWNRELDEARLLIQAKAPREALALLERNGLDVQARMLEAWAFLSLDERPSASERLRDALRLIEAENLTHLRPQAQELERRL